MKSLLIDVKRCVVEEVEVTKYTDFYKYIGCSAFDVAGRYIGDENRWFDIFVDDIGMLREDVVISAINGTEIMLAGNLVIAKTAENGEQLPLSDDDIKYLCKYIRTGYKRTADGIYAYPVLVDVKYTKD